jgi:hypothetical protein
MGSRFSMRSLRAVLVLSTLWLVPVAVQGQGAQIGTPEWPGSPEGRYAIHSGPEDVLQIDVQVWGQVNRPGQYSVPDRTDLIGLISWAGGPTESAKLHDILVIRPLADKNRVQEVDIEKFLRSGDPLMIPRMSPGDVVVVPANRSHGIVRWAGVVSVAALVANVAILARHY